MSTTHFFKHIEQTYGDAVHSIKNLIDNEEHIHTSHMEVNIVLILIAKLRIDFKQNSIFTSEVLEEMLKGGHLQFQDNGSLYDELIQHFNSNLRKRNSSHKSCAQQHSLSGPILKEVLFGVSLDTNGNKTTWVQFERHNMNTIIEFILHLFDYLMHRWTGKNIGPYGSSHHTEKNPLIIGPN